MEELATAVASVPAHAHIIRGLDCYSHLGWPRILFFIEQKERTIVTSLTCVGLLSAANAVKRTAAFGHYQFAIGGALSLERLVRARARFSALCVHTLSFSRCDAVTDVFVNAVALQCCDSEVESVNLWGCKLITDASIEALARSYPKLKSVDLTYCTLLTDASIGALAGNCPLLESVNLACCSLLTDLSVVALAGSCPLLESVTLCGCKLITDV